MRHQLVFSSIFTCLCLEIVSPTNLCSTAGLCCKHRDSECVAQKVFPNHTVDTSQLPCYCDHACIKLDDCCSDYKHFCSGKLLKPLWARSLAYSNHIVQKNLPKVSMKGVSRWPIIFTFTWDMPYKLISLLPIIFVKNVFLGDWLCVFPCVRAYRRVHACFYLYTWYVACGGVSVK